MPGLEHFSVLHPNLMGLLCEREREKGGAEVRLKCVLKLLEKKLKIGDALLEKRKKIQYEKRQAELNHESHTRAHLATMKSRQTAVRFKRCFVCYMDNGGRNCAIWTVMSMCMALAVYAIFKIVT